MHRHSLKLITEADRAEVIRMSIAFLKASDYKDLEIDLDEVNQFIDTFLIDRSTRTCIILLEDNKPVGLLVAICSKNFFNKRNSCAEVLFWIDPDKRGFKQAKMILDAYQYWAKTVNDAQFMQLACPEGRVELLYKRLGFKQAEYNFVKEL